MERRITFFVTAAEQSPNGWVVKGEVGLSPIEVGGAFSFVHHQDGSGESRLTMQVKDLADGVVELSPSGDVLLRAGDVLGGEVER